jgi:hypothetical protein
MLQSIIILTKYSERIVLKKINNIEFFLLNYKQNFCFENTIITKFKNFFIHTYLIYFLRIIWRGKAFRIRFFKKSNKFTFNFGHSHWLKLVYSSNVFKFYKIKRQSYLSVFNTRQEAKFLIFNFNSIREMNKYTKRGIRVKTVPYIKRFGKISQVNSSLHSFG